MLDTSDIYIICYPDINNITQFASTLFWDFFEVLVVKKCLIFESVFKYWLVFLVTIVSYIWFLKYIFLVHHSTHIIDHWQKKYCDCELDPGLLNLKFSMAWKIIVISEGSRQKKIADFDDIVLIRETTYQPSLIRT